MKYVICTANVMYIEIQKHSDNQIIIKYLDIIFTCYL